MPSTLKRRHRQDLTLRKSFLETIRSKFSSVVTNHRRPRTNSTDHTSDSTRRTEQPICRVEKQAHRRRPIPYVYTNHSIRVLPPELLAYAFILGSEEDPMLPITVSHVCNLWRELAMHTPALWRRIWLGSHYHIWRERIYRAKSCSLDVVLWSPDHAQPFTWAPLRPSPTLNFFEVQSYMHIVSPYIRRWRSLDIRLMNYTPYLWNGALSECCSWGVHAQAPLLEELTLVHRQNDDTKEFCLFSGHAPRLRRATIDGIRLTWLPSLFQNLTFLDYTHHGFTSGYQAIQEVVTILQVSSRLSHLRLLFPNKMSLGRRASRGSPVIPQVHLPFLKTLHLRVETKDIPYEFIFLASLLVTPTLTSLHLIDTTPQRSTFSNIRTFMSLYLFPPSLQSISVHYGWYTKELVNWMMDKLPSLRQLKLKRRDGYVQIVDLGRRRRV